MLTICVGKSTYARCGIIVNVTPFEPEWEGFVTLEISNTTPLPAKIYANEGLCQILFFQGDEPCETSYKDKAREVPEADGDRAAEAVGFLKFRPRAFFAKGGKPIPNPASVPIYVQSALYLEILSTITLVVPSLSDH